MATAGHVDHGKSTLVRHLTGVDPDRLDEEKRRGLTIDLGFAVATLPSGAEASFIDVPGHARFLSTMAAGVGSVTACLFVVSGVEGWRTQSEEHLRVLDLLGVKDGIVVLTRTAALDQRQRATAADLVRHAVGGTFLAGREVIAVDLPGGVGESRLLAALDALVARAPAAADVGRPRLWVDRVFSIAGAGTVVTGTLVGGSLDTGRTVELEGRARILTARIRGLQMNGRNVDSVSPGRRVALNLSGVDRHEIGRGVAVVEPGRWHRTRTIDVALTLLAGAPALRSGQGAHLLHLGTDQQAVHVRLLGKGSRADPGSTALARLRFGRPLPLFPGDRFILRDSGRAATFGGGIVLDIDPVLPAARASPDLDPARVIAERRWVETGHLERLIGTSFSETVPGWVGSPEHIAAERSRLSALVEGGGALGLGLEGLSVRDRLLLATLDGVEIVRGRAWSTDAIPAETAYLRALRASPFQPPSAAEHGCSPAELRALRALGLVVHFDGVDFAIEAVDKAADIVTALLARHPGGITVAQARDVLRTTRRWAIPLLGVLDRRGVTQRRGDLRVLGAGSPSSATRRSEDE